MVRAEKSCFMLPHFACLIQYVFKHVIILEVHKFTPFLAIINISLQMSDKAEKFNLAIT